MKYISAAMACCILSGAANAASISVNPTSDDWFYANDDFTAFTLSGDPSDSYLRTFGYFPAYNRSALEFAISPLDPGSVVTSATFSIQSRGTSVAGGTFSFWGYAGDGLVTVADATNTVTLLHTAPTQGGQPLYSFDVSAFIQMLADADASHAGILITVSPQAVFYGSDFVSAESNDYPVSDRPRLTVNYEASAIPEPASAVLLAAGLIALATRRRTARAG